MGNTKSKECQRPTATFYCTLGTDNVPQTANLKQRRDKPEQTCKCCSRDVEDSDHLYEDVALDKRSRGDYDNIGSIWDYNLHNEGARGPRHYREQHSHEERERRHKAAQLKPKVSGTPNYQNQHAYTLMQWPRGQQPESDYRDYIDAEENAGLSLQADSTSSTQAQAEEEEQTQRDALNIHGAYRTQRFGAEETRMINNSPKVTIDDRPQVPPKINMTGGDAAQQKSSRSRSKKLTYKTSVVDGICKVQRTADYLANVTFDSGTVGEFCTRMSEEYKDYCAILDTDQSEYSKHISLSTLINRKFIIVFGCVTNIVCNDAI